MMTVKSNTTFTDAVCSNCACSEGYYYSFVVQDCICELLDGKMEKNLELE